MKHTHILALVTALLLLWLPCAQATSHIASYHQGEGVEIVPLSEFADVAVPDGLEAMYQLFAQGNDAATVYLFRMPGGHALVSISCLETDAEGSTEALYEQRAAIATGLQASMTAEMTSTPEFRLEDIYGQQALVADMTLYVGENRMQVNAQAALFYRGEDLLEVWTAHPGASTYLFNKTAAGQLESDLAAMDELLASLDFSVPEEDEPTTPEQGEPEQTIPCMTVTADDGSFAMDVPVDTVVIHSGSDEAAVARARALLDSFEGGPECFDLWYADVKELNCWLLISPEYGVAAQVYVGDAGAVAGLSAELMMYLEEPVLEILQASYDTAVVADETTTAEMDGMDHAWMTYEMTKNGANLLSYVLAASDEDMLYELDLYVLITPETDGQAVSSVLMTMMDSLDYQPQSGT